MALLITMPRPEGPGWWKSGWYAAVDAAGVIVLERATRTDPEVPASLRRMRDIRSGDSTLTLLRRVEGEP